MKFSDLVMIVARCFEAAGIGVMVLGTLLAAAAIFLRGTKKLSIQARYRRLRQDLGSAILLGLELLVAADIIRTVSEFPTLEQVTILGAIVLIRTFLSFTLEVELEGKWPWQRKPDDHVPPKP
jgi:uncharacterized membrane protein